MEGLNTVFSGSGAKPDSKPVLEVNLDHQLLKQVSGIDSDEDFKGWATLLFEQAVLAEGGQLEDPAGFVQRVNRLMLKAGWVVGCFSTPNF